MGSQLPNQLYLSWDDVIVIKNQDSRLERVIVVRVALAVLQTETLYKRFIDYSEIRV